jgi:hypothetical protein
MASILQDTSTRDRTIRIYDGFYNFSLDINPGEYDVVLGYMKSVCQTTEIAKQFTAMLFKIAQEIGESPMALLEGLQGKNGVEMNQVIAYYFNSFKSKTSLYGYSVTPTPNQSVQRNIVV